LDLLENKKYSGSVEKGVALQTKSKCSSCEIRGYSPYICKAHFCKMVLQKTDAGFNVFRYIKNDKKKHFKKGNKKRRQVCFPLTLNGGTTNGR